MKRPMSVVIITKDPKSEKEIHYRYDIMTVSLRLGLIKILLSSIFKIKS